MKCRILILLLISSSLIFSQEDQENYFSFYKGGVKYLKPIKYLLFNPNTDKKIQNNKDIYFFIGGERFKFYENRAKTDTLNLKFLEQIKISNAIDLTNDEYRYYNRMVTEDGFWKKTLKSKPPMPITKTHQYFKIYILENNEGKIIRRVVDWEKLHKY